MSSLPMYGVFSKRLLRLDVTCWDASLSKSHDGVVEGLVARWACGCHGEPAKDEFDVEDVWTDTRQNKGHRLAV